MIDARRHASRRGFLSTAVMSAGAVWLGAFNTKLAKAQEGVDGRVADLVRKTIGIDTHNHIDVPLTSEELPGPDIDLAGEMKKSGLSAICMTFATDYQPGDAYDRFLKGLDSMDRQLKRNAMKRSLTAKDVQAAHAAGQPTVIQSVEGGHFLQGHIERVALAYDRGLRHLGLLHDSDAGVPLGDVYTNPPRYGGLTDFGAQVIRECNRIGMLVDLAHADFHTTEAALKVSKKPVVISHTGPAWLTNGGGPMFPGMQARLISKKQAKLVADAGGAVGIWTHMADTPLDFAHNLRAVVDVIGVDHVMIGTDTKLTPPSGRPAHFPRGDKSQTGQGGPDHPHPEPPHDSGPGGPPHPGPGPGPRRFGERTNLTWEGETVGFYYVVVDAMLKAGFTANEIGKIGGANYLRIFAQATDR